MGPNTEPWGTPDNTESEQTPSMMTFCVQQCSTGGYHFGYHNIQG